MASVGVAPTSGLRESVGHTVGVDRLPEEMNDMKIRDDKEVEATVVDGNGTETGHIIVTTIGGRNGQPKQTISYMAERVVGHGSFGVVFQAKCLETGETVAIKKIFRALSYIHRTIGVCHRDIKPQNLLESFGILFKADGLGASVASPSVFSSLDVQLSLITDFWQVKGEPNISYICSRYYRAPELIFGATEYTTAIDVWSAGCVLAELLLGQPLFPGESGVDQLVEIIKIFHKRMPPEAVDLVSRLLQYSPNLRCAALDALIHPFFDELRDSNTRLPNGRFLPPIFNFKPHGMKFETIFPDVCFVFYFEPLIYTVVAAMPVIGDPELKGVPAEILVKLIPEHARKQCSFLGL
ncbi:hypothetical protein TEA_011750 [Camellia sinensis var. sinensis]|uniref:Protein kinase domain-containing protein n=1 Tax=Camellia sinensis var. sinensis TaxID=542762 RepID=A0A4S4DLM7_CAMSN|nr:hypothetical protein TEA_011750 [Camellia sinensis var. sinensis]